jgi:CheY-like chemotaxis protein
MATIIVIDDEADVRDAIELTLAAAGHVVRSAPDGPAGLEACRLAEPDLVITDLVMPVAHGFDVIAQLRSEFPRARIIAISGGGNFATTGYQGESVTTHAYLAAARELGADALLSKPFGRRELLGVVDHCLVGPTATR